MVGALVKAMERVGLDMNVTALVSVPLLFFIFFHLTYVLIISL